MSDSEKVSRVTSHAERALKERMGAHAGQALSMARRAFAAAEFLPDEWEVPQKQGFRYFRYGDFAFVFGRSRGSPRWSQPWCLVTVVGPFKDGVKWDNPNERPLV